MRRPLLTVPMIGVSMIGAGLLAAVSARAADMVPPEPPAVYAPPPVAAMPPPVVVEPPPVVVERRPVFVEPVGPAPCWRYGRYGWGRYPCVAGPPAYWHDYRYGYRAGYGGRPYWAHARHWHRSYW